MFGLLATCETWTWQCQPHDTRTSPISSSLQSGDGPLPARAHHFPRYNSLNGAFSNSASASSRFNITFSRSSSFNRLASSTFIPPYRPRQRCNGDSETRNARHPAATSSPLKDIRSACPSNRTIYSGDFLRFVGIVIVFPPRTPGGKTPKDPGPSTRGQTINLPLYSDFESRAIRPRSHLFAGACRFNDVGFPLFPYPDVYHRLL
ncbi:hypothetical protein GALL_369220 [mine drainage metagenome]|uniref:Uncharacterized protein n=1 Tax=mine drainage metagenome TaxID=410659 RepID=A0A1J5QDN9_9ZZZZ